MLDKLKNLIDVKSIITILLTVVFCILTLKRIISQEFLTIYTTIIAFYFGTQYQKGVESKNQENSEK